MAAERIIRSVHTFMKRLNLERLTPHRELVEGGLCLADIGRQYVVYLPQGGKAMVDLSGVEGGMEAWWYNPRKCRDERKGMVMGAHLALALILSLCAQCVQLRGGEKQPRMRSQLSGSHTFHRQRQKSEQTYVGYFHRISPLSCMQAIGKCL